jgi:p-methyltransferase
MDLDNALSMLRHAKENGIGQVVFADDTFNVPKERFEEFLDIIIAEDLNIPWYSFLRCQYINQRIVKKMKKSGCQAVFLGIESGSDSILKNMKKGSITDFYLRGIEWLKSEGIKTVGAFVIGFPGETLETANATRHFIETSRLDYYFLQPFFYLHHAPIHHLAAKYDLTGEGLFWSHKTMDWRQSVSLINKFFYEIENPIFLNPDFTLWELVYFRSKGLSIDTFDEHRVLINKLTKHQMKKFSILPTAATERDATFEMLNLVS